MPSYGKLTVENYPKYIFLITGFQPCPICNGPVERVQLSPERAFDMWGVEGTRSHVIPPIWSRPRCVNFPIHEVVARHDSETWERDMGKLCECGYYMGECKQCIAGLCICNTNKTSPIQ